MGETRAGFARASVESAPTPSRRAPSTNGNSSWSLGVSPTLKQSRIQSFPHRTVKIVEYQLTQFVSLPDHFNVADMAEIVEGFVEQLLSIKTSQF
jgi:hypothetical protein